MKSKCNDKIAFSDGDIFNYSISNLKIMEEKTICYKGKIYKVLNKIDGHINNKGKSAGIEKNSIYETINIISKKKNILWNVIMITQLFLKNQLIK